MSRVASLFLKLTSSPEVAGEQRFLGEAKDALYRDQIEINGWSWDLGRASEAAELTKVSSKIPPPPNSVVPSALKFSKTMCRASAGMLGAMRDGSLLKAVFALEEDSSADFLLRVTLDRVRILEYELAIDGMEVTESWKLNYETIRFDYRHDYADARGEVTATLTRHAGSPNKDPAVLSGGANTEKILGLADDMDEKELRPLLKKLESTLNKKSLPGPVPAKAGKVTKDK
jgi:type VI protein secretion system component Hcp